MKVEYTLTLADFKAARRLHRGQKLSRRVGPYICPILTVVCLVGAIVFSETRRSELFAQCFGLGAGALVCSIGLPIQRFFNIRRSFKRLFPPGQTDRTSSMDIDDDRILRQLYGVSELKVLWTGVFAFAQDKKITMFYTNKDCFLLFPTQIMSSAQRTELKNLVARNMVKKAK